VAAGLTTLRKIARDNPYAAWNAEPPMEVTHASVRQMGSAFTVFCRETAPRDLGEAKECDTRRYGVVFHCLLDQGIYLPPAQFETAFLSAAHRPQDRAALRAALQNV